MADAALQALNAKEAHLRGEIETLEAQLRRMASKASSSREQPPSSTGEWPAPSSRERPPSLLAAPAQGTEIVLDEGEAMLMGEIMGMMQAAPTPALAAMLTALRGKHNKPALSHGSSMHISKSSDVAVPAPEASALPAATAAQLKAIHSGRATLLRQILLAYFRRHFTAGTCSMPLPLSVRHN